MLETNLVDRESGKQLYIGSCSDKKVLVTQTHAQIEGVFKAKTLTAAGTEIVSEPRKGGSIVITDLILTTDKTQGSVVTVQFNDGTYTEPITVSDITDAPCNIATSLAGYWRGWKDARLEVVIAGGVNPTATLAAGYFKLDDSLRYADWDARR